jgi:hypothetical protein
MNPEDVKALVDQLMKTGEFLASNAYRIALRQNYAFAVVDIVLAIILVVVCIAMYKLAGKAYNAHDRDFRDATPYLYVLSFFAGGFSIAELCFALMRFISPEWFAISDLLNLIK